MTNPDPHPAGSRPSAMVAQLSDLHLRAGEEGSGAVRRLAHAVRRVAELQPPPDAVLVSGDLADVPSTGAYAQARQALEQLGLPVHVIPGNHDDRDLLRAELRLEQAPAGTRVNFAVRCGGLRLVGCDSTRPGSDAGELGARVMDWLARTLSQEPGVPTLLALHHPPVPTGVRSMDAIALACEDRAGLAELLAHHPQVLAITCGHVHTAMASAFAGRPLLICPSTNSALRLDLRPRDDLPFEVTAEPIGFLVHALIDGRLVSHFQPLEQRP